MKVRVAITEKFHPVALARLTADPGIEIVAIEMMPKQSELKHVEGLITRSRTRVDANLLSQTPNLKWVISTTAGFDHIDLKLTTSRGITVMHTPEAHAAGVAELTLGLMVGAARHFQSASTSLVEDRWRKLGVGTELSGKSLGIVGLGRIGTRVAKIADALGLKLYGHDPYQNDAIYKQLPIERASFDEILRLCDIITFHVPLTPYTWHMFHMDCLEVIPQGQILINTSRGKVIEEKAVIEGLRSGALGAVGLDVFEIEPLKSGSPLLKLPGVLATPHIGALTSEAFLRASMEGAQKALDFIHKGTVSDTLPPQAEWYQAEFAKSNDVS